MKKFLDDKGLEKVKEYYSKNVSEFHKAKKVKARHILVSFKDAKSAQGKAKDRSKEEAKKRAEAILQKVRESGADFAEIAADETDEPSGKTKGGDLGYFAKEDMAKEFSDAAFNMKLGETSGVVESPFGFHIIKVEGVQEAVDKKLEDETNEIAKKIIEKEKQPEVLAERAGNVLKALKEGKTVNQLIDQYKVKWTTTGDFSLTAKYIPTIGTDTNVRDAVLSLKKSGELYGSVVDVNGDKYILS